MARSCEAVLDGAGTAPLRACHSESEEFELIPGRGGGQACLGFKMA